MLKNYIVDDKVAITGTINSGGIIGVVSGVKAKIKVAAANDINTILIPKGTRMYEDIQFNHTFDEIPLFERQVLVNETIDLVEYGKTLGVEVIEVSHIDEATRIFTGADIIKYEGEITITDSYNKTMQSVAYNLCNRSKQLYDGILEQGIDNESILMDALNLTTKGKYAYDSRSFYSAASFCFGANVKLNSILLNLTDVNVSSVKEQLEESINDYKLTFNNKKINTITDLQTRIVVNERLSEALKNLDGVEDDDYNTFSYAFERFQSALSWSYFYGTGVKELIIDDDSLKDSCIKKLKEAEERYQYANLVFPDEFTETKKTIADAFADLKNEDFDLCLFKASKAKAQTNVFIGLIGNNRENIDDLIDTKHAAIEQIILDQNRKGNFPILGYSYYEYSKVLKGDDDYSSLLYAEYALEMADLDMYFEQKSFQRITDHFDITITMVFILGILIGIVLGMIISSRHKNKKTLGRSLLRKTSRGKKR
jgi:uncharacterized protein